MKKNIIPLLLILSISACQSVNYQAPTLLKATTSGHFTDVQIKYLTNDDSTTTSPYNGNMSVSIPQPVNISWECNSKTTYYVGLYKDEGCLDLITTYETSTTNFDFYNPLFNQDYYVKVSIKDKKDTIYESAVVHFKETPTISGPRNIYIDGVENVRDIGGWGVITNNQYLTFMKQGMVYRSGRFNEDKTDQIVASISEKGLFEIKNHLKIKTEVDLRRTSTNEVGHLTNRSVLGDDVKYVQLPMAFGGNNILTFQGKLSGDEYEYDNPQMIKQFFEVLADENNYPIDFHCSIGKDRTGCLAYLLEGLLSFDLEIMHRDYMFTNFSDAGMCKITDLTNRYEKTILEYETTEDNKIYAYLNEVIGVSSETLDKVIAILKA